MTERPADGGAVRPLRIVVVGNNYPPHTLGGYELLCRDHVGWLRARGHHVAVLTSTYGLGGRRRAEDTGDAGERVVRALDFHWRDYEIRKPHGLRLVEGERRQRRALEQLLDEERPDAVQLWHMACISKALVAVLHRRGLPVIAVVGEPWPAWDVATDAWLRLWSASPASRRRRTALDAARRLAAVAVAPVSVAGVFEDVLPAYCSDHLRRDVEARFAAWRGRGVVIHNGIDVAAMERPRDPGQALHDPLRLLYCGRVERRKGVATAVAALGELRGRGVRARLTVAGWRDDAYAAELRELARGTGVDDAVEWREPVARAAVPDLYAEHDVLVVPSLWEEPFGLVALEGMAAGCVVVGTGSGGSAEILHEGVSALLHRPGDGADLARRVAELAAAPDLVARLREGGRRVVAEHDISRYNEATLALLRSAVAQRRDATLPR